AKILRDNNGAVLGYDAFLHRQTNPLDDNGHGTHCTGIAAAQVNNGVGVAGIAGGDGISTDSDTEHVRIMPVKVLDASGSGDDDTIGEGIRWAADSGAKVISMSFGRHGPFGQTLDDAIQYAWGKGCVLTAAAGNENTDDLSYPAADANVLAV